MGVTMPRDRVLYAEREVGRYREDVEDWKRQHQELEADCWFWERVVAKANVLFDELMEVDASVRESVFKGDLTVDQEEDLHNRVRSVIRQWLDASLPLMAHVERIERDYQNCDGAEAFREHISEAKGILTPDDQFFQGEPLARLRDEALEEHRSGRTVPWE